LKIYIVIDETENAKGFLSSVYETTTNPSDAYLAWERRKDTHGLYEAYIGEGDNINWGFVVWRKSNIEKLQELIINREEEKQKRGYEEEFGIV